ncbi:hypothetical protein [Methylobacterium sp. J-076]|uniref:hypothetical protein n=1 Tax=Methylobacterium sp. J-076 TaxID=2836655 RepID=UPI001FB86CE7|nr:hypothetical protein [Methylobacterium sp. J-076]
MTVPLDEAVYELMRRHAEVAGLSISRFGEQAIKDSVYVSAQEEAVREAVAKYDGETVEHFNGKIGFCFAKFASDAFIQSIAAVAQARNLESNISEEHALAALADPSFRRAVEDDYLSRREDLFAETWQFIDGMAVMWKLASIVQSMKPVDRDSFLSGVAQAFAGRIDQKHTADVTTARKKE